MTVWIARDYNKKLYLYNKKPVWHKDYYFIAGIKDWVKLDDDLYPEIQPGECKEFKLLLTD